MGIHMYDRESVTRSAGVPIRQPLSEVVCWTRMQAEAGQPLTDIVARKEAERAAGGGIFCWGVGNPPSRALSRVRASSDPVDVVFSIMKSKPKVHDAKPSEVLVWRSYIDGDGALQPLPEASLVTSRGDTLTKAKLAHYALLCFSSEPLVLADYGSFDPTAYRNVSDEAGPIGSSQVTALVRRVAPEASDAAYRINLRSKLTGSYWVRLAGASTLTAEARAKVHALESRVPEGDEWIELVSEIRSGAVLPGSYVAQPSLF